MKNLKEKIENERKRSRERIDGVMERDREGEEGYGRSNHSLSLSLGRKY